MKANYVKEIDQTAFKNAILREEPARQIFLVVKGTYQTSRMIGIVTFGHLSGMSEDMYIKNEK
jgi:hypothetical protein